jgi:hypothetical protein
MRACMFALAVGVALAGSSAYGHGPQIQITIDSDQIVTRKLILEEPYADALTAPKSVYVMPMKEFNDVWYSRPNDAPNAILPGQPAYFSGPGFAYGFDLADGGPQEFEQDSVLSVKFTDGLKLWDGTAFNDPGSTELKAFSGSSIDGATNFAITTDGGASTSVTVTSVADGYGSEGENAHATIRYGLLGDGSSSTSTSPNGVYLASLQLSSTQDGLAPSDEFLFVLAKNVPYATTLAAVASLGFAPSKVQWLVPEPGTWGLLAAGSISLALMRRGCRWRKRD